MNVRSIVASTLAMVAMVTAGPTAAVTNGDFDGENHPHVGLMVAFVNGTPSWRCSGTLIAPTVYLTAGHCTYGATSVQIWFDADVQTPIPTKPYPFTGDVGGTPHTHPDYPTAAFIRNDVGVVVLDRPISLPYYGQLPSLGALDVLSTRRGLQDVTFTAVGYGLQRINPVFVESARVRMYATPRLLQINTPGFTGNFSILLSNNHSTGGTCFGDSGGPNFIGTSNVIGGVTSFGINGNCAGTGGVYRVDTQSAQDFVKQYLP